MSEGRAVSDTSMALILASQIPGSGPSSVVCAMGEADAGNIL